MERNQGELFEKLALKNWVERRNAATEAGKKKLKSAEEKLILLLEDDYPQVVESAAKSLAKIKSNRAVPDLVKAFYRARNNSWKSAAEAVIEALGQSNSEEAMLFLGKILTEKENETILSFFLRMAAAKNLAFYPVRKAVEFLHSVLLEPYSLVTERALLSLAQIGSAEDVERISETVRKISLEPKPNAFQKAIEREGFSDSNKTFLAYFASGCVDRIKNRLAKKILVVGWLEVFVDMKRYQKVYQKMRAELASETYANFQEEECKKYWKNPAIAKLYLSGNRASELMEKSAGRIPFGKEHPDVQAILTAIKRTGVPFRRSSEGIPITGPVGKNEAIKLVHWPKDGSLLIPALRGFIPFSLSSKQFPVTGETAFISGQNPLLLISEAAVASIVPLQKMFPDITIETIPCGFVTTRLPSGQEILIGTSHTDCVFNTIPAETNKENIPVVLVDPCYYKELLLRERNSYLLGMLKEEYEARFVIVPKEEAYLNPACFILADGKHIILNHAAKTYEKLLKAGVKEEAMSLVDREIVSLAPLKGAIGCLAGIYCMENSN